MGRANCGVSPAREVDRLTAGTGVEQAAASHLQPTRRDGIVEAVPWFHSWRSSMRRLLPWSVVVPVILLAVTFLGLPDRAREPCLLFAGAPAWTVPPELRSAGRAWSRYLAGTRLIELTTWS